MFSRLTDPQVVESLARGAVLVRNLLKVLIEARLQRNKARQRRKVVLYRTNKQNNALMQNALCYCLYFCNE